ncbi:MAG: hypothetical protein HGA71_20445, partial [Azonexaceae bacterium]|nr:hypothetical protein [Azonexaceae bacterium]
MSQAPNSAEEGDDTAAIRGGCNAKWVVESLPHRPVLKKSSRDQHQRVLVRRDCGFRISLRHGTVEEAYTSLKGAIEAATTAINDIIPENSRNAEGIYAALDLTITSHKQWQLAKRGWDIFKFLKDLKPQRIRLDRESEASHDLNR